jgi:chromosome segregation ATPase
VIGLEGERDDLEVEIAALKTERDDLKAEIATLKAGNAGEELAHKARQLEIVNHGLESQTEDLKKAEAERGDDRELEIKLTRLARLEGEVEQLRHNQLATADIPDLLAALKKKLCKAPVDVRGAFDVLEAKAIAFHKAERSVH